MIKKLLKIGLVLSPAFLVASCSNEVAVGLSTPQENTIARIWPRGEFESPVLLNSPVMTSGSTMLLFTLNEDGNTYAKFQTTPGNENSTWPATHVNLGKPSESVTNTLAAAKNSTGKVWVFRLVNSGTNRVYYRKQTVGGSDINFTSWTPLSFAVGYGGLKVTNLANGNIALFTKNAAGILCCVVIPPESQGVPFMKPVGKDKITNFTIATNSAGKLEAFTAPVNSFRHITMLSASTGVWETNWTPICNSFLNMTFDTDADLRCIQDQQHNLVLFVNANNPRRDLYTIRQVNQQWVATPQWIRVCSNVYKKFDVALRTDGGMDLAYLYPMVKSTTPVSCTINYAYLLSGATSWVDGHVLGVGEGVGFTQVPAAYTNTCGISLYLNKTTQSLVEFSPCIYVNNTNPDDIPTDYYIVYHHQKDDTLLRYSKEYFLGQID